jgi:hypothetical protein
MVSFAVVIPQPRAFAPFENDLEACIGGHDVIIHGCFQNKKAASRAA